MDSRKITIRLRRLLLASAFSTHRGITFTSNRTNASLDTDYISIGHLFTIMLSYSPVLSFLPGDAKIQLPDVDSRSTLVPVGFSEAQFSTSEALHHLRWLIQKYLLKQDVYLIGPPGPFRRRLAFYFCEIAEREVEYLGITRDTTEADLKQRSEVLNGTLTFVDQVYISIST